MTEQPEVETFEVPTNIVIDNLRQEVARLNDERVALVTKLQFANQVIEALKQQLESHTADGHEHSDDELPADDAPVMGPAQ